VQKRLHCCGSDSARCVCVCASVEGFACVAGGVRGGFNLEPATSILLLELFTGP
jgi:hypothetical protein